ncbi:hypothetical protein C8R41DRAFT_920529 [Lentinula lateritia]|uniref:Uncharacterized protein n=1 Tax=Lentinula lateritia TaxID=40482 RepID=A0ABQ8VDY6_9AGAR|nr:hypothetical protein C8R41DRAFT_920529 [Lentinula lateritia]
MRFTFASVMFVVVAALFTIFTAEAAAVPRPEARAPEQPVEVVTRAVPESGPIVAARMHARDFHAHVRSPASVDSAISVEKRGRAHARDFRADEVVTEVVPRI